MDTLSRDSSSSSSSIVPMAGLFAAVLALILAIVSLVKLSGVQKSVNAQGDHISSELAKISTIENEVRAASAKSESDIQKLRDGVQNALNAVGTEMGTLGTRVGEVEKSQKARASTPAATKAGS